MIVWGSSGKQLDLGAVEERECETCQQSRSFRLSLVYKTFHLYYIFKRVTEKQYWMVCEACENGWELDSREVERALGKSPIPAWDRYGLAAFGVVVASLVGVAIATAPPAVERSVEGTITTAGNLDPFQIRIGDCFNDGPPQSENAEVTNVAGTPCSEPHDNEVYAVFDIDLLSYPGSEEMGDRATAACLERFEAFVDKTYETSVLAILPMYPTSESWTRRNDREVVCAVYHMELQKLVGSMRGSGM